VVGVAGFRSLLCGVVEELPTEEVAARESSSSASGLLVDDDESLDPRTGDDEARAVRVLLAAAAASGSSGSWEEKLAELLLCVREWPRNLLAKDDFSFFFDLLLLLPLPSPSLVAEWALRRPGGGLGVFLDDDCCSVGDEGFSSAAFLSLAARW
jgi:hypothetical protein